VAAKPTSRSTSCCPEPYLDLTFSLNIRRKTLFYGVNLICPCLAISFLTILVFYLPASRAKKMSLSINILLSLTVFFLLIFESVHQPRWSCRSYSSTCFHYDPGHSVSHGHGHCAQCALALARHLRDGALGPPGVHAHPAEAAADMKSRRLSDGGGESNLSVPSLRHCDIGITDTEALCAFLADEFDDGEVMRERLRSRRTAMTSSGIINEIELALEGVRNIATHMKKEDERNTIRDDWKYVAVVLDRLFMWLFSCAAIIDSPHWFSAACVSMQTEKRCLLLKSRLGLSGFPGQAFQASLRAASAEFQIRVVRASSVDANWELSSRPEPWRRGPRAAGSGVGKSAKSATASFHAYVAVRYCLTCSEAAEQPSPKWQPLIRYPGKRQECSASSNFDVVFEEAASQSEVFDNCGVKDLIQLALEGPAAGKCRAWPASPEAWFRGRSRTFSTCSGVAGAQGFKVYATYFEIYNEQGLANAGWTRGSQNEFSSRFAQTSFSIMIDTQAPGRAGSGQA
uniref:GPS domain-containing protein n=1 Tax=Macrostomum lignano TaxID=282301 RepID=A0A1I8F6N9_9PLAT